LVWQWRNSIHRTSGKPPIVLSLPSGPRGCRRGSTCR
jgi:hypothetical protein